MKNALRTFWPLIVGIVLAIGFSLKWSEAPAPFTFLDPFNGVWNRGLLGLKPFDVSQIRSHFVKPIRVQIDRELIPHIFAQDELDALKAQGYYVASQRLWQMEFLSRLAEGRLSEIFGRRTLSYDRHFRQMRLKEAALESARLIEKDEFTRVRMEAFTKGVNLFIEKLKARDLPFEFKMFDTTPQKWSVYRSALILKLMTYNLSGFSRDIRRTRSLRKLNSVEAYKVLFPENIFGPHYFETEMVATNDSTVVKTASPGFTKSPSTSDTKNSPSETYESVLKSVPSEEPLLFPSPSNGSNSMGIQKSHSANDSVWLANDVHLDLVLPSLWYEIQISTPDFNAMGVSLPGAPGIILGINQNIAWGSTNASTDTFDWFLVRSTDSKNIEMGKHTQPLLREAELITVRNARDEKVEMVGTKWGPIYTPPSDLKTESLSQNSHLLMKWTGHQASNEFQSFLLLMRARSTDDCRKALSTFVAPAQNIACADKQSAEIVLAGALPHRAVKGDIVIPLEHADQMWGDELVRVESKRSKDSPHFFVNANQSLSYVEAQMFGKEFAQEFRAQSIAQELSEQLQSVETLKQSQNSTHSEVARRFIPFLVASLPPPKDPTQRDFLEGLEEWNGNFDAHSPFAPFFNEWIQDIEARVWSTRLGPKDLFEWPRIAVLLDLISQPEAEKWKFLKLKDDELSQHIEHSFRQTFQTMVAYFHKDSWRDWRLSEYQQTEFTHISQIPGLQRSVNAGGSYYSPFANYGHHGPTWKMIANLKSPVKAWRLLPGGNSGDPLSRRYGEKLDEWARGEIHPMNYYKKPRFNKSELLVDFNKDYPE